MQCVDFKPDDEENEGWITIRGSNLGKGKINDILEVTIYMASHQFRCTHLRLGLPPPQPRANNTNTTTNATGTNATIRTPEVLLLSNAYPSNLVDSAHHMGKEIGQLEKDLGITSELDNPYNFLEVGEAGSGEESSNFDNILKQLHKQIGLEKETGVASEEKIAAVSPTGPSGSDSSGIDKDTGMINMISCRVPKVFVQMRHINEAVVGAKVVSATHYFSTNR